MLVAESVTIKLKHLVPVPLPEGLRVEMKKAAE
jgi:hypothetical protein